MKKRCQQCSREVAAGGFRVVRKDVAGWLCGTERCSRAYDHDGAPAVRRRVAEVVAGILLVEKADFTRAPKRARFTPTPADVSRVLRLRETGLAFHKISAQMGWSEDPRGARAYKIVKGG